MVNHHHQYKLGEIALSCDIETSHAADAESKRYAPYFQVGDGAFIRRSDRVWRYAIVSEVSPSSLRRGSPAPFITFTVAPDGSTKKVGPRHWGDRLRPLKREMATLRDANVSRHTSRLPQENGMRSSSGTSTTSPFDSQNSAELERTADRAGGHVQRRSNDSSDDASTNTSPRSDLVEDLDEVIPKPKQRRQDAPRPRATRRESWKDMAAGFIRKLSGGPVNHLATEMTNTPEDEMNIHEFSERPPSPNDIEGLPNSDETPEAVKTKGSHGDVTNSSRRRPNSRQNRGSFTLTTSGLFKNLMKGGDVLLPFDNDSRIDRRATEILGMNRRTTIDLGVNDEVDDAIRGGATKAGKYKPRRSGRRRATFQSGMPSPAMMGGPSDSDRGATKSTSNNSNPRPSYLMREALTNLMEEKKHSSNPRIGDLD